MALHRDILSQITATRLEIGYQHISSTGTRSSNQLQWLDLKIWNRDSSPSNDHEIGVPYCNRVWQVPVIFQDWNVKRLTFEQDPEPVWLDRDNAVKRLCKERGVQVIEIVSHTLWDPAKCVGLILKYFVLVDHIIMCSRVLNHTTMCPRVLNHIIVCAMMLGRIIMCPRMFYRITMCSGVLDHVIKYSRVLDHITMCSRILDHIIMCSRVLDHIIMCSRMLDHIIMCSRVLGHIMCSRILDHINIWLRVLEHIFMYSGCWITSLCMCSRGLGHIIMR